ncbi:putative Bifunctional lycopene cyclase/phytoene synthase [Glarea lozoyensis 74030]|uniref:Putative Bifunctional lycopene cyclase/phytoene synthase n=1 Tax=Glarea lozoyensis (strain ATCC 74030 / MF5533) TaxID=1104152 RepID=H0EVJ9_GLAL7|nr:putative Bifunctional lycopene cyclase/phytoene synthase [Glarea lozoyensis 74030]
MRVAVECYMEIGRVLRGKGYVVKRGRATVPILRRLRVAWGALGEYLRRGFVGDVRLATWLEPSWWQVHLGMKAHLLITKCPQEIIGNFYETRTCAEKTPRGWLSLAV